MLEKFGENVKAIVGLIVAFLGMCLCIHNSIQSGILRTVCVFFLILFVFFLFEIIFSGEHNYKKKLIARIVAGSLFLFWIGTFFLSTAMFHNTEFFSSMVGYSSIRNGKYDSVLVSDKFQIGIFEHKEYVYLIAKGKEDEEISNIVKKHFGKMAVVDDHKIYNMEQLKGFVSTYEKDPYTIIILV